MSVASSSADRKRAFRDDKPRPQYVPGIVVCRVADASVANVVDMGSASPSAVRAGLMPETIDRPFKELISGRQIRDIEPIFSRRPAHRDRPTMRSLDLPPRAALAQVFAASVRDSESEQLRGLVVVRIATTSDPVAVAKDLQASDGVEYAHAVPARWLVSTSPKEGLDPLLNRQWGLRAIRYFESKVPNARAVKVAVLDTGIDTSHPDLAGAIAGYDHGTASTEDVVGHGTHVAGIIAARTNNKLGISGIADPELHIWKIFPDEPASDGEYYVDETMYLRALNAVRTSGMRVVNLSIGGSAFEQTEATLFRMLNDEGINVVAAMGNDFERGNPTMYPAAHAGSIAVGAINEANRRAYFSNTGDHIALSAPGMNVLSTLPMKTSPARDSSDVEYNAWSGTSMAAPHVAGVAALVLAQQATLDGAEMKAHLQKTAAPLPALNGKKFAKTVGAGLVDLKAALS